MYRLFQNICLVLAIIAGLASALKGQNLVPNYSFETLSSCPETFGGAGPTVAPPWFAPTSGTPDIFNECCTSGVTDVPVNFFGNQPAVTGVGYCGAYAKLASFEYREYLSVQLDAPLVAGEWYSISFYVSPSEFGCAIETIGAYLSPTPPPNSGVGAIPVDPQIEYSGGFINDYENWTLVSGCFSAAGGEQYITIGNFHNDADTPVDPLCGGNNTVYYYYDDVVVIESDDPASLPLDLGGPEEACFSYEIDPMIDDYTLTWEDGSHGPTLTVTESGTYSLTISDGCSYGVDSIEIIINGNNTPPDLGPEQLTLCAGETYEISLDPDIDEYTWQDGSHDPDYTISSPGNYAVTLDDGCATYEDDITVFYVNPPDPIDLGPDVFLCLGDEIEYDFDPSQGDYTWQDGMVTPVYSIDIGGTYSVTVSNMCGSETDEVIITDLEVPEVEIGPDEQTLCSGNILEIEVDPSLGDILWNDGSSEANYEITAPGTYTVFVTNQCGTGSDQVEVDVVDSPIVELGPDVVLCEGETIELTTFPVNGTYTWQDNSTGTTFLVTQPGWYSLTIENFCGFVSDDILVDYVDLLDPIDFGPDVSLCPGEQIVLYANNPGAQYQWQDFSTADSLVVTTSGTYYVQAYNSCSLITDTIMVTVNGGSPTVDLPDQLTLCQGQSITLDAAVGGVTYLWSDNSTNQQLSVTNPGTYSITISSTCGSDRDTVIILDGGPAPLVDLGADLQLCPGESFQLSPSYTDVDTWLWNDGSASDNYTINGAGEVSVQVNNGCGVSYDTLQVSLLPTTPPFDLGIDTAICAGASFSLSINLAGANITWSDGSTNTTYTVNGPGEYYATAAATCGTSSDTILVTSLPDAPPVNLGPDQSLCPGEVITLNPGIPGVTYLWQDGSTNSSYQATQQETVIVTISNSCSSSTDTLLVIESTQGPQLDLGPDIQVCAGETVIIPSGISGVTYEWQDGSALPQYTTTTSGTFTLEVSNSCGSATDTIVVDISGVPPAPDLGTDTTLCEGIALVLISTADVETDVLWQDGSDALSFVVNAPGTYTLSESNRCGDAADTIVVDYLDAPDPFSLGRDTTLCPGESLTLVAPSTPYNIQWQDGSNALSIIADQSQTYTLQISNDCGTERDELVLSYDTRNPVIELGPAVEWCEGDVISFDATQSFGVTYVWSTGSTASSIEVNSPGVYTVDITAPCATASDDVEIVPGSDCDVNEGIYVPNVFSPNGDQINEVFTISFGSDLTVTAVSGTIYDRWGNLVFSSDQQPFEWNGFFGNEKMQPGVYAYLINVTYTNGTLERSELLYGDVTLIR